jgi:hypothetical protein
MVIMFHSKRPIIKGFDSNKIKLVDTTDCLVISTYYVTTKKTKVVYRRYYFITSMHFK